MILSINYLYQILEIMAWSKLSMNVKGENINEHNQIQQPGIGNMVAV
jgi:hypothetical protein